MTRKSRNNTQPPTHPAKNALLLRETSLSEVKDRLLTAIKELRASSDFPKLAAKKIGEFWIPEDARAPFEEEFTLKQIAEIDIDTFFKKRSVVASKVVAIVNAIENALSDERAKPIPVTARSNPVRTRDNLFGLHALQYEDLAGKCNQILTLIQLLSGNKKIKKRSASYKKVVESLDRSTEIVEAGLDQVIKDLKTIIRSNS